MIHKKHFLLLVALVTVLLLISACSPIGGGSGGSNLTVLQLLQNSSKAMKCDLHTHDRYSYPHDYNDSGQ